jgi:hypothetical protein
MEIEGGKKPGFGDWIVADQSVLKEISARYICFCTCSLIAGNTNQTIWEITTLAY